MPRKWQTREDDKGSGEIQSNIPTSRFIRAAPHNYNASDKNIGPRSPGISTDRPTCQWQNAKKVTPRYCISADLLKTNDRRRTRGVTIQWVEEEKNSADEMCCGCQSVRMEIQCLRSYFGNTMETDASGRVRRSPVLMKSYGSIHRILFCSIFIFIMRLIHYCITKWFWKKSGLFRGWFFIV